MRQATHRCIASSAVSRASRRRLHRFDTRCQDFETLTAHVPARGLRRIPLVPHERRVEPNRTVRMSRFIDELDVIVAGATAPREPERLPPAHDVREKHRLLSEVCFTGSRRETDVAREPVVGRLASGTGHRRTLPDCTKTVQRPDSCRLLCRSILLQTRLSD